MKRPTERRRHKTIDALGDGYAAGCITTSTFELRLDAAHRARTLGELRRLTSDLPIAGWLARVKDAIAARAEAPAAEAVVRIAPPPDGPGPWVLGRETTCALVLGDDTVSRRHAQLRRTDDGWEVLDLGSTNGTRVNGWRVEKAILRPGDVLHLGELRVELTEDRAV